MYLFHNLHYSINILIFNLKCKKHFRFLGLDLKYSENLTNLIFMRYLDNEIWKTL